MANTTTKQGDAKGGPKADSGPIVTAVRVRGHGPELEAHQIILHPLVTEKGTHQSTHHNQYPFEVNSLASKEQIRSAVEELFSVRVISVRTMNRPGKMRRFRGRMG